MDEECFEFSEAEESPEEFDFENTKNCPHCGKPVPENALFCLYCGGKVSKRRHSRWVILTAFILCFIFVFILLFVLF